MDLILFGMQGSGKGTQAKMIAEQFDFKIFEAGAQLRRLAAEDSELGHKIKTTIESGQLVPTELVMEIIEDFLGSLEGNAIFDGIPRSADQQEQLDELMKKNGRDFKSVLIEISEEEALRRLTTRRLCKECKTSFPSFYEKEKCEKCNGELLTRKDDTPDAIRTRLDTFSEKTAPVINNYKEQGKIIIINGEQKIDAVYADILVALKEEGICQ